MRKKISYRTEYLIFVLFITFILVACGGGGNEDKSIQAVNKAPIATNIVISDENDGEFWVGDLLIGSYAYQDAEGDLEGGSTFRWLLNGVVINGATSLNYVILPSDVSADIIFEVTPKAATGTIQGQPVSSIGAPIINQQPVANPISKTIEQDTSIAIDIALESGNQLGDPLSAVTVTSAEHGTTEVQGSIITYTPSANYAGVDQLEYNIVDVHSDTATSTINLTMLDTKAPEVIIHFPALVSLTDTQQVLVTGSASDASLITQVMVAGVAATSTDDYANWRVIVPLKPGINDLSVEATDELSNINLAAATLSVTSTFLDWSPRGLVVDSANNRALITDAKGEGRVIELDLDTGVRSIFSDQFTPNELNPIGFPHGIDIDVDNNRLLVVDAFSDRLFGIDLASGERTILSGDQPDSIFRSPFDIVFNPVKNNALVLDVNNKSLIIEVDLQSGEQILRQDTGVGFDIAFDQLHNRLLSTHESAQSVNALGLGGSFNSYVFSDNSDPTNPFEAPRTITVDALNNRALVFDRLLLTIFEVDLDDGTREVFSDNTIGSNGINFHFSGVDIVMDETQGRVLTINDDRVLAMDLATGVRSLFEVSTPDKVNSFFRPYGLAFDSANQRMWVVDDVLSAVIDVDLETGARSILSERTNSNQGEGFVIPRGIAFDSTNERLLVHDLDGVIAVELISGERTILSASTGGGANGIAVDSANNRALIVARNLDTLVAVDLDTGERTTASSGDLPFMDPQKIALDPENGLVYVTDSTQDAVWVIDMADGEHHLLSTSGFEFPMGIALDKGKNRALVVDLELDRVVAVDLESGIATVFSDNATPNNANPFDKPIDIVIDHDRNRAIITDRYSVFAVDLESGERVVISKSYF